MAEQWEKIIEHEIKFYASFPEYENDLKSRLKENNYIRYPTTRFDGDTGRIYFSSRPWTEEQVINRIEVQEAIESLLSRAQKRIERLANALGQLNDEEFDLISSVYLDEHPKGMKLHHFAGFRIDAEFQRARRKVLSKMFSIYQKERAHLEDEWEQLQKESNAQIREERTRRERAERDEQTRVLIEMGIIPDFDQLKQ
jgi:hypothetical protein